MNAPDEVPDAGQPARELSAGPVTLVAYSGSEAKELNDLVAANLDHLRPWMQWARVAPTEGTQLDFVRRSIAEWGTGQAFGFWMREEASGEMVGSAGLHSRIGRSALEIGYWVSATRVRRGYATASARALTTAAFGLPGISRVEIHCDEANVASWSVARRLGYRLLRVDDRPVEAPAESGREMVWAVAADEWAAECRQDPGVRATS